MKKSIIFTVLTALLLVGNFLVLSAGISWQKMELSTDEYFTHTFFSTSGNGWIVSYTGGIYKTQNHGLTWQKQQSGTSKALTCVYFTDPSNGWITGDSGLILTTSTGGETWSQRPTGTDNMLNAIVILPGGIGWAVGASGTILKSVDNGTTWQPQTSGLTMDIDNMCFVGTKGWAVAGGAILGIADGGNDWTILYQKKTSYISDIFFADSLHGWYVTLTGEIFYSSDGGLTWSAQESGLPHETGKTMRLFSIHFVNTSVGRAVGELGIILHTTDGGTTWTQEASMTNNALYSVFGTSELSCYAVGARGVILSTTASSSVENGDDTSHQSRLRIVPNPSRESISLEGNFPEDALVSIYSLTGVKLLEYKRYDTNTYNFLASGVYIVRIGNQSAVLVKQE